LLGSSSHAVTKRGEDNFGLSGAGRVPRARDSKTQISDTTRARRAGRSSDAYHILFFSQKKGGGGPTGTGRHRERPSFKLKGLRS